MKKTTKILFAAVFSVALLMGISPAYAKKAKDGSATEKPAKEKKAKKAKKSKKVRNFDYDTYKAAIFSGDYDVALGMLSGLDFSQLTTAQKMDLGMIKHWQGDYVGAAEDMENASRDFDLVIGADPAELFRIHAAKAEYRGSLYEYMLVDAFNVLNYYRMGDLDSAYSRAVKTGDKQRQYMADPKITGPDGIIAQEVNPQSEEKTVSNATKAVIDGTFKLLGLDPTSLIASMDSLVLPPKPDTANDIYRSSAFADYLQIVLGLQNSSNVDDYVVNELKTLTKGVVDLEAAIPADKGRIEVLALGGTINQKQQDFMIADLTTTFEPILGSDVVKVMKSMNKKVSYNFYYPKYVKTVDERTTDKEAVKATKVTLNDGTSAETVLLEDFDTAVMQDVNLKARRTAQRNVAADVSAKTPLFPIQVVTIPTLWLLAFTPKMQEGVIDKVAGGLNDADPKADIRQCFSFPANAYRAALEVAPGKYTVTVEYSNGKTETIENVEVKAGKPVLVESVCK